MFAQGVVSIFFLKICRGCGFQTPQRIHLTLIVSASSVRTVDDDLLNAVFQPIPGYLLVVTVKYSQYRWRLAMF